MIIAFLLAGGLPAPPRDGGKDRGAEEEVGSGGEAVQTGDSLGEFEEEVTGSGGDALFFGVAAEEAEDQDADAGIGCVGDSNYGGDCGGGPVAAPAGEGGRKGQSGGNCEGPRRA